ncbi:NigD-like protein [Prevotella intermedia]|uniref:NigD-like protein n=2 Tax=Prevotella intermedia TaxID=28131 RepID=A0AAJ3RI68_PREIN|nr:NigD-like protein [Prevotella intermedia]PIK17730.1 NigD-like protein [Prevotella intermedia]
MILFLKTYFNYTKCNLSRIYAFIWRVLKDKVKFKFNTISRTMKTSKIFLGLISIFTACSLFTSCDNDNNDNIKRFPNAIVTIKPINGGESFNVWVSEKVQGPPSNLTKSPYGNKEVRAIANIKEEKDAKGKTKIYINWMDSIRTKQAIVLKNPELELKKYGEDRLEIINGFGTVVEDGYLTLRFSTAMRDLKLKRDLNLIVQHSEKEPYKLVLAYNAHGDNRGRMASSLIAFRLSEIDKIAKKNGKKDVTLQLHWKSYQGDKQVSFKYHVRDDSK